MTAQAAIAWQLSAQRLQAATQSSIPPIRSQSLAHSMQKNAQVERGVAELDDLSATPRSCISDPSSPP